MGRGHYSTFLFMCTGVYSNVLIRKLIIVCYTKVFLSITKNQFYCHKLRPILPGLVTIHKAQIKIVLLVTKIIPTLESRSTAEPFHVPHQSIHMCV